MHIVIYYWYHDINKIFPFYKACIYGNIFMIKIRIFPITIWQLNKHSYLSLSWDKCSHPSPPWLDLRWTPCCLLISFSPWDPKARFSMLSVFIECWLHSLWDWARVGSRSKDQLILNLLLIPAAILIWIPIPLNTYVIKLLHTYAAKAIWEAYKFLCLSFLDSLHLQNS